MGLFDWGNPDHDNEKRPKPAFDFTGRTNTPTNRTPKKPKSDKSKKGGWW